MSNHNIAVNPDGNICYLQEYNPYNAKSVDTENQTPATNYVQLQYQDIYISTDDFRKAIELERYSKFIKFICCFDGTLTLINAIMINPYYICVGFVYYCGYQGANQYNKRYLYVYL